MYYVFIKKNRNVGLFLLDIRRSEPNKPLLSCDKMVTKSKSLL